MANEGGDASVADMVSKESYEALKAQLDQKTKYEAAREQRLARFEEMERQKLVGMQRDVNEMIEMEVKDNPNYPELQGVGAWGKDLHQVPNVEANLGIARVISCFSQRYKRTLDEASKAAESSAMLASTLKELEECKAERDAKTLRCTELETLSNERQTSLEKLEREIQNAGLRQAKFNFALASSRETDNNAASSSSSGSGSAKAAAMSAPTAKITDPLLDYVSKAGTGGLRMHPSGSQHHVLGSLAGNESSDIAAAISASR